MLGLHTIHFYYTINSNKNDLKFLLYTCKITKNKMPTRQELLDRCKGLKLKGFTTKSKDELIKLLERYEKTEKQKVENPTIKLMEGVINELCNSIKKDTKRKVCLNCHELGHDSKSYKCSLNIEKIKKYISSKKEESDDDDIFIDTSNYCNLKKQEIKEVCIDEELNNLKYNCSLCNSIQYSSNISSREWKEYKNLCDLCWGNYDEERDKLWKQIKDYMKDNKCNICGIERINKGQRFHHDHINMFDKKYNICDMANRGDDMELIKDELVKCQLLCISCHSVITDIENKLSFTTIKKNLTRQLNRTTITEEEYNLLYDKYRILYREKMDKVYDILKSKI
jgi:hypothetical protein